MSSGPDVESPGAILRRRLRAMRVAAGLSQADLSEKVFGRRDQSIISRVETGSGIELHEIEAWAAACGAPAVMNWSPNASEAHVEVPADKVEAIAKLASLPPTDLALLARAGPLLAVAPTARKRLAFEIEMWGDESRQAAVNATIASVASTISGALQGRDADAMRLLMQGAGVEPVAAKPKAAKKAR